MEPLTQLLELSLEGQRYALYLAAVERLVRMVAITPLPQAPDIVLGVIDVEGRVLPVLNLRRRFRLPEREVRPADLFLVAHTTRRTVVLAVDEIQGVIEQPATEIIGSAQIVPGLEHIQGVVKLHDGLVLIHDLEQEAHTLDEAMSHEVAHGT